MANASMSAANGGLVRSVLACGFYPLLGRLLPLKGHQGGPRPKATIVTAKDEKVFCLQSCLFPPLTQTPLLHLPSLIPTYPPPSPRPRLFPASHAHPWNIDRPCWLLILRPLQSLMLGPAVLLPPPPSPAPPTTPAPPFLALTELAHFSNFSQLNLLLQRLSWGITTPLCAGFPTPTHLLAVLCCIASCTGCSFHIVTVHGAGPSLLPDTVGQFAPHSFFSPHVCHSPTCPV